MHIQYCTIFIEKNPSVSGPTQFKPVLYKGQLYDVFKFIIQN